jgi:hypothetical protein
MSVTSSPLQVHHPLLVYLSAPTLVALVRRVVLPLWYYLALNGSMDDTQKMTLF